MGSTGSWVRVDAREEVHRGPGISWRLGKLQERQWEDVFRFMPLRSERLLDLQKELLRGKWLRESGSEWGGGRAPEDGPDVKWRMGELRGQGRASGQRASRLGWRLRWLWGVSPSRWN